MAHNTAEVETSYTGVCASQQPEAGKAVREVLDRVGGKWSLLVIYTLAASTCRYSRLRERIPGISQRMLTVTLKHLERDGLVERRAFGEVPPRVEYSLTDLGQTLIAPAHALASWAIERYPDIEAARARFDAHD